MGFLLLATLVCVLPSTLAAADHQCGPEPIPNTPAGVAFQQACNERESGLFVQAVSDFESSARLARAKSDYHWQAKAEVYKGGVQMRLFQYAAALETTERAAELARSKGDPLLSGSANGNISTVYALLGNFAQAEHKLEEAIDDLNNEKVNRPDLLSQTYNGLAYQQLRMHDIAAGIRSSELAIAEARKAKRWDFEASAWDFRGYGLFKAGKQKEAEEWLNKAIEIYQSHGGTPTLTLEHLAELKHTEEQNEAALADLDKALAHPDAEAKRSGNFYPLNLRANILEDLGRTDEALAAHRKAVQSAGEWRRYALPGDTTNIETVDQFNNTYQSFAELAARESLKRHDEALSEEAFDALAENRAATLREELAGDMGRNRSLPPEYLSKLGELQSVQARITLKDDAASQEQLKKLQTEIAEIETRIGLEAEKKLLPKEKNSYRNSLRDIQTSLRPGEALLSFCLGDRHSFLWSVTGETMHLYELPSARDISKEAVQVRDALEHKQNYKVAANYLSTSLFGSLAPTVRNSPDWLIIGDGVLLDRVPFSVLPAPGSPANPLVQTHRVRLLPSELMLLSRHAGSPQPRFLGIADPLYNLADSRRTAGVTLRNTLDLHGSKMLARLPGSQREVRNSAQNSGMPETELLIGPDANLKNLARALASQPELIHFAVHVVRPPAHPEQAALALSLGPDNLPQLLTREKISTLHVPGSIVVLSGCSSGQGQADPGSGLIGLSRAWLLAGASAVVVSNWPTPDDSGQFFGVFYSRLGSATAPGRRADSLAERATIALQQAQLEMQRRGGYGSAPGFWGAYSIVSKE